MQGITLLSTLFAVLLVVGLAWLLTRRQRAGLPPEGARHVFRRSLFRLSAWALAGYMAYMVVISGILGAAGLQ